MDHPGVRRPSAAPRRMSVVGGPPARSFADFRAADRPSFSTEMPPPLMQRPPPHRRPSMFPPPPQEELRSLPAPLPDPPQLPLPSPRRDSLSILASTGRPPSTGPEPLLRGSFTRPSPPEPLRPTIRRSSLIEIIRAKSGDVDTLATLRSRDAVVMEKPSLSEPGLSAWSPRRESAETIKSVQGISLNSDGEGGLTPSLRGRKRAADRPSVEDEVETHGDPAMRGREVFAENARRVAEEECKARHSEDRGASLSKGPCPNHTCALCAKTFPRPSSLRIHTYSHAGERPFVCKEPSCWRRFSVQSNLNRHAKVHQMGAQVYPGGPSMHQLSGPPPRHGGMSPHRGYPRHWIPPGPPGLAMRHGMPPPPPGYYPGPPPPPGPPGSGYPGPGPHHTYDHPPRYGRSPLGAPRMPPPPGMQGQHGGRLPPTAEYPPQPGHGHGHGLVHGHGPPGRGVKEEESSELHGFDEEDELDEYEQWGVGG